MNEDIELSIESPDGTIDCRLEPELNDDVLTYSATILYPQSAGSYSRSDIYCYNMVQEPESKDYTFAYGDEGIHPKIMKLEKDIAAAIKEHLQKSGLR